MRERFLSRDILPRLPKLIVGLFVFGSGIALMAAAGVGLGPWEVLHQGISRHTGLPLGTVSILLGVPILLLWLPIGERPGIGTVLNVLLIGTATNLVLPHLPTPDALPLQLAMMVAGVVGIGVGSGMYLGSDLGSGPRDGLMTGLHHKYGWSIRRTRTAIELIVLALGFLMGGTVGIGTVTFAFGIGPVVQWALGIFDRSGRVARRRELRILEETPGSVGE